MQMSQRSLQRRAAQAQVHPAPGCAGAGGRCRALLCRRATGFSGAEAPKDTNSLAGGAGDRAQPGKSRRDAAAAHLLALVALLALAGTWVHLGAGRLDGEGRGEAAPVSLRAYGGQKGPEAVPPVTNTSPTFPTWPRGPGEKLQPPRPLARGAGSGRRRVGLVAVDSP